MTDEIERLRHLIETDDRPTVVNSAKQRLAAIEKGKVAAKKKAKERKPISHGPLRRYQVNGKWKLSHRIADWDKEGDIVNGWSDRT